MFQGLYISGVLGDRYGLCYSLQNATIKLVFIFIVLTDYINPLPGYIILALPEFEKKLSNDK